MLRAMETISPLSRRLSAIEFTIGAAIVVGHNVLHVVPNEVPILFVLGWLSLRLRNGAAARTGIGRFVPMVLKLPQSWWMTLAFAVPAALLMQLDGIVLDPVMNAI